MTHFYRLRLTDDKIIFNRAYLHTLPLDVQRCARKVEFVKVRNIILERHERYGDEISTQLKREVRGRLNERIRSNHPWLMRKSMMDM